MEYLKLYKLLVTDDNEYSCAVADELRWASEAEFLVWISYPWLQEFMSGLKDIFGNCIFDDGAFNGNFQEYGVCINLYEVLEGYDIDLEKVFPKDKYSN